MTLTNRIGRPMLAAMFVSGGADQLRHPDEKTDVAATVVDEIDERIDVPLPQDTRDAVRLNGAVQLVAGGLLAINRVPRLASTALAASLVPTTLAAHRFWEIEDEQTRAQQRIHFFKNLAMLGGLVITMGDTGSRPSTGWRARRAVHRARTDVAEDVGHAVAATVATGAGSVVSAANDAAGAAEPVGRAVRSRARDLASLARSVEVPRRRGGVGDRARALAGRATALGRSATEKLPDLADVKHALPSR